MTLNIESMMKKTIKEPSQFNYYPYEDQAIANQFVFAIEGFACSYISKTKSLICRIVPKIYWEKKKLYFTQGINIDYLLGENCSDLNETGCWFIPDFSSDPLTCANQLVEKGFIWDKELQKSVNKDICDDAEPFDYNNFQVVPHANIAVKIYKEMTPAIELEIFEARLGVQKYGIEKAMLNFYEIIRTSPITKEKVILQLLKKYKIHYNINIDNFYTRKKIVPVVCWLDKSEVLKYYIDHIDKNMVDEYGRSLLNIAQDYKSKKCESILIKHGFKNFKK